MYNFCWPLLALCKAADIAEPLLHSSVKKKPTKCKTKMTLFFIITYEAQRVELVEIGNSYSGPKDDF